MGMNNDSNHPFGAGQGEQRRSPSAGNGPGNPAVQQRNVNAASANNQGPNKSKPKRKPRPTWLRVTLGILKYLSIPIVLCIAVVIGLYIGYVKLGDRPASDMLHWETWKHLFDLVFAEK